MSRFNRFQTRLNTTTVNVTISITCKMLRSGTSWVGLTSTNSPPHSSSLSCKKNLSGVVTASDLSMCQKISSVSHHYHFDPRLIDLCNIDISRPSIKIIMTCELIEIVTYSLSDLSTVTVHGSCNSKNLYRKLTIILYVGQVSFGC